MTMHDHAERDAQGQASQPGTAEDEHTHFTLATEPCGEGGVVVRASGEIDMLTAPRLREELLGLLDAGHRVILDLDRVDFLGSSGLAALVDAHRHEAPATAAFALVADSRTVVRPLEVTGLDRVLTVHPTLERARESFGILPE
ncbi:STAS domain-containing protein [Actinoalloteichus spitiensis]|uniref:STAS domain-containing protein n=1 Tax=Actinoalloteichus spitiensis TaxID=252394 RepID=UPI00035EA5B8|nr:STAS domain-containing protein [Actinoalloteichus spitiensis]